MDFANDFVVDDPLTFCYLIEGKFAANIFRFGSHYCYLVSLSSVCLNFSGILWLRHVGDRIEFSVLVRFFSCVGARLEFDVLVSVFVFVHVDLAPFIFLFCLSLSNSSELDYFCEGCGAGHFFLRI